MNTTYMELADRAIELLKESEKYRVIIVVIGSPGSGKSTVLREVCDIINDKLLNNTIISNDESFNDELSQFNSMISGISDTKLINDIESDDFKPYKKIISPQVMEIYGKGGEDTKITITQPSESCQKGDFATVVPMDGFHLTRKQLSQFKDPETAIFRRGSPFTFDNVNLINLVKFLKMTSNFGFNGQDITTVSNQLPTIQIPGFSHHLKDPVPNEITISSNSRILILEGLYFLLKDPNWIPIGDMLTHTPIDGPCPVINTKDGFVHQVPISSDCGIEFWKIIVDPETCLRRIASRHLLSGIVQDLLEGERRYRLNDSINGELVMTESLPCDLCIYSVEEDQ